MAIACADRHQCRCPSEGDSAHPEDLPAMSLVRVLIADPDQLLVASYREFLAGEGFEVATAADGLDCMAKLRSFAPDVLVLEPAQLWGGGDGVLARLREEADLSPAKVLVLSARLDLDRLDCQATPG